LCFVFQVIHHLKSFMFVFFVCLFFLYCLFRKNKTWSDQMSRRKLWKIMHVYGHSFICYSLSAGQCLFQYNIVWHLVLKITVNSHDDYSNFPLFFNLSGLREIQAVTSANSKQREYLYRPPKWTFPRKFASANLNTHTVIEGIL
jgi:hypothetical protein